MTPDRMEYRTVSDGQPWGIRDMVAETVRTELTEDEAIQVARAAKAAGGRLVKIQKRPVGHTVWRSYGE